MPYLIIENFEAGLDTRKTRFTAPPGSLRVLKNAHITRGKEIERRKEFVTINTLPADTVGLHAVNDQLVSFGSVTTPAAMPATIQYQQLTSPNGGSLERIYATENFAGKVYVVAGFTGGSVHHFYDGVLVDDWESLAGDIGEARTVAIALGQRVDEADGVSVRVVGNNIIIQGEDDGTAFTLAVTANLTATQLQAPVAAQGETIATAEFEITGGSEGVTFNTIEAVTLDDVDLIGSFVNYTVDNATTATAVADRINSGTSGYTANAVGAVVTISAPINLGASANGRVLEVTPSGTVTVASIQNMAGGADPTPAVPQISQVTVGAYAATGVYTITLNSIEYSIRGRSSAIPVAIRVVKQKMYAIVSSLLYFSGFVGAPAVADPTKWINGAGPPEVIGAGFIDISTQSSGSEVLTGIGVYQDKVAVFSKRSTQIWTVDPDPANNIIYQVLSNVGAIAAESIVSYGDLDVFFLSESGMRSLRARDSSNLASANDVGVAIDADLTAYIDTISRAQLRRAKAIVEPTDSRYLLSVGEQVSVFSNFPGSRVAAWSTYELGGEVLAWAISDGKLHARVGDEVKRYGGLSGNEYSSAYDTVVTLPFLDAENPGSGKAYLGIDAGLEGTWEVEMCTEPDDQEEYENIASLTKSTYGSMGQIGMDGEGTHISLRFTCSNNGPAKLGNAIIHYTETEAN